MSTSERSSALTELARLGFGRLAEAETELAELEIAVGIDRRS